MTDVQLGVLFVHGIGQQKRGDTLLAFGEPLCRWLRQAGEGSVRRQFDWSSDIQLQSTLIGPDPVDPRAPAHTRLRVGTRTGESGTEVILAESCWAEAFPTPTFREVAKWALLALPWTLVAQFARRFEPVMADRGALLRNYPGIALDTISAVMTFLAGAIVQLCVVVLLLLAIVPIPRLREFLLRLQLRIAALIGDSYVLLDSPIRSSAIISQVRADLDWLAERCERVALVAHSQGAAVAHRVIDRLAAEQKNPGVNDPTPSPLEKVYLYFSFGSGLKKLHDIELAFQAGPLTLLLGFVLMAAVIALAVIVPVLLLAGPRLGLIGAFCYLLLNAAGVAIVIFLGVNPQFDRPELLLLPLFRKPAGTAPPDGDTAAAQRPRVRWVDCYATADPVSAGPIFASPVEEIDSQPVHNRAAFWSDHTTYWDNPDEFIRLLVEALGPPFAFQSWRSPDLALARRRWRVEWLSGMRMVFSVTVLVALWGLRHELAPTGARLATLLTPLVPQQVAEYLNSNAPIIAVLSASLVAMIWFHVMFVAWKRWQRRDVARIATDREFDEGGLPFLTFVAVGAAFPATVLMLALFGFDLDRVRLAVLALWAVRSHVGFGLFMLPIFSALAAFPTWLLAQRADERRYRSTPGLHGEAFVEAWIACASGAFFVVLWLAIRFPEAMTPITQATPWSQQAIVGTVVYLPYLVISGIVALFSWTLGERLSGWLTDTSVRAKGFGRQRAITPRSIDAMGLVSCACGATAIAARAAFQYFGIDTWAGVVVGPLFFVACVAGMNAFARDMAANSSSRGQPDSLGLILARMGFVLAALSLLLGITVR